MSPVDIKAGHFLALTSALCNNVRNLKSTAALIQNRHLTLIICLRICHFFYYNLSPLGPTTLQMDWLFQIEAIKAEIPLARLRLGVISHPSDRHQEAVFD